MDELYKTIIEKEKDGTLYQFGPPHNVTKFERVVQAINNLRQSEYMKPNTQKQEKEVHKKFKTDNNETASTTNKPYSKMNQSESKQLPPHPDGAHDPKKHGRPLTDQENEPAAPEQIKADSAESYSYEEESVYEDKPEEWDEYVLNNKTMKYWIED